MKIWLECLFFVVFALGSAAVSAQPQAALECEIALAGSYLGLVKFGIAHGLMTAKQANDAVTSELVVNPLAGQTPNANSLSLAQGFDRILAGITLEKSVEIRAAVVTYLKSLGQGQAIAKEARGRESHVIMARLIQEFAEKMPQGSLQLSDGRIIAVSKGNKAIKLWIDGEVKELSEPEGEQKHYRPMQWPTGEIGVIYWWRDEALPKFAKLNKELTGWQSVVSPYKETAKEISYGGFAIRRDRAGHYSVYRSLRLRQDDELVEDKYIPGEAEPTVIRRDSRLWAPRGLWIDDEDVLLRPGEMDLDGTLPIHVEYFDDQPIVFQIEQEHVRIATIPPSGPIESEDVYIHGPINTVRLIRESKLKYAVLTHEYFDIKIGGIFGNSTEIKILAPGAEDFIGFEWIVSPKGRQLLVARTNAELVVYEPLVSEEVRARLPLSTGTGLIVPLIHGDGTVDVLIETQTKTKVGLFRIFGNPESR